jgi:hypothetical protein
MPQLLAQAWEEPPEHMANILIDPPFAANPPVKVNVPAKTLGLVLLILGAIGIIFGLLALFTTFGVCTVAGVSIGGCGFPILWLLGALIGLIGVCVGTLGAYQMYQLNRDGKRLVIYGLALGLLGAIVTLIGNIIFYSGLSVLGVGYGGAIFGLIIDVIVYGIVWYLVIISRWPGDAPLVATGSTGGYGNPPGGYGSPPPPPPPSA